MEIFPLLCIITAAWTGLAEGSGILPDGPLNGTVGGTIVFTTTQTPAETQISTIQWRFEEKQIFFGLNGDGIAPEYKDRITFISVRSLELRNLSLNDSGEYTVDIVTTTEILRGTTRLDVYVPISNVTLTANNTDLVEFNSSARLSCSSSGSSPSFLWLNGSSEVTASDRVQLTDGGSTLIIVSVTRYDQGLFRCHVTNPVSNGTSDAANFNISYGPENTILSPLPQEHYEEGSDITLSCSAVSQPPALFYWLMNGKQLNETGPDLKLLNVQMNQSGSYSCRAFNLKTHRYDTSQSSVLSVLERISNTSVTSSTSPLIEGGSVNLTCEAAGSVFSRTWMKDGSALITSVNMSLYEDNRVLSFKGLDKRDSGEYSCRVSNPVSDQVADFTLEVNYGPENVQIKGPAEIQFGQTLTLSCSAESRPAASYNWTLNGTLVEGQNSSILTKAINNLEDGGTYACHAVNFVTDRSSAATHQVSITEKLGSTSSCSAGCIAGIVIACIVVIVAVAVISYCICKRKKAKSKNSSSGNNSTMTGNGGHVNTAYTESQELNYTELSFSQSKDGGRVQPRLQNDSADYAEIRVGNNSSPASSPPDYDEHMERVKSASPQLQTGAAPQYAQIHRNITPK